MNSMQKIWMKRSNALLALLAVAGIVILLNFFASKWFGRLDVSENRVNSLSEYSVKAMQSLLALKGGGDLEVKIYASADLPDKVKEFGGEADIRGIQQKMEDLLEEYRANSGGKMLIENVREEVVKRAEEAGLQPFVGEKTELQEGEGGRLEMKQYVFGISLNYKGVMEVLPKPLLPDLWEYQITRAILRLNDRIEEQRKLEIMFDAADEAMDLIGKCNEQITAYTPKKEGKEELSGIEGLLKPIENMEQEAEALHKNRDLVAGACSGVGRLYERLNREWGGKYKRFDDFLHGKTFGDKVKGGLEAYSYAAQKLLDALSANDTNVKDISEWKNSLANVKTDLEQFLGELKKSAGQKALGFVCGHYEFCPIPSETPVLDPEKIEKLKQQNQQFAGFLDFLTRMELQINQMLVSIEEQMFRKQDFSTVRVDASKPIPDNVEALLLFAPRKDLSELELYHIDQFLLRGGTVMAYVPRYDVNVGLFKKESYLQDQGQKGLPDDYAIYPVQSNVKDFVAFHGIEVENALVLDAANHGTVTLPHLVRRGNIEFRGQKEFPFPLFVYATTMDSENVLVRSMPGIMLPYASPLKGATKGKKIVTPLVSSSAESVAFRNPQGSNLDGQKKGPSLALLPEKMLQQASSMDKDGPHPLVMLAEGDFDSYFAGKSLPEGVTDEEKADRLDKGKGRLLVVGSDLGLVMPQPEFVFADVKLDDFKPGPEMLLPKLNVENWQIRISQVSAALQKDGLPFLMNSLDWGVQRAALADIRAKQNPNRRIESIESASTRTGIQIACTGGLPLLFLLAGLGFKQWRTSRRHSLKQRFSVKKTGGRNE